MSYSMNTAEKRNTTIRLEDIPEPIRSEALKLDKNNDGDLSLGELAMAIDSLYKNRRTNKGLRKTILAFIVLTILLIAGIFGATIAGAILSKDFGVNSDGFATVKNSNALMQTTEAIQHHYGINIGKMSNEELSDLQYITVNKENLKFYVKGHARDRVLDRVMILVEGGTVTYDNRFIVDATGDAKRMLENAMGLDEFYMHPTDRRWLQQKRELTEEEREFDERVRRLNEVPTEAPTLVPTPAPPTDAPTATPPTDAPTATPPTDAPTATPPTDAPTEDATPEVVSSDAQSDNTNQGGGSNPTTVGG